MEELGGDFGGSGEGVGLGEREARRGLFVR
jgi:hypothetical protein